MLQSPLRSRKSIRQPKDNIQDTLSKIDDTLKVFETRLRHATHLEEMKYLYIQKLDRMEDELKELKMQKKQRQMEQTEKDIINQLTKKTMQYKEESDKLFLVIHEIRKQVQGMEKNIRELQRKNQLLAQENNKMFKVMRLSKFRVVDTHDVTLQQTIKRFLDDEKNQGSFIYPFIKENQDITNLSFLNDLATYVDKLLKSKHSPRPTYRHDRATTETSSVQRLPTVNSNTTHTPTIKRKLFSIQKLRKLQPPSF